MSLVLELWIVFSYFWKLLLLNGLKKLLIPYSRIYGGVIILRPLIYYLHLWNCEYYEWFWTGIEKGIAHFRLHCFRRCTFRKHFWSESDPNYRSCTRKKLYSHPAQTTLVSYPRTVPVPLIFVFSMLTTGLIRPLWFCTKQ